MAVQWVSQAPDGSGVGFDVDETDRVTAVVLVNNSPTSFWVEVHRTRGNREVELEVTPGMNRTIRVPPARAFRYADDLLAEWYLLVKAAP